MIDCERCMAPADRNVLGGARCQKVATHTGVFGALCETCAELERRMYRNPNTLGNMIAGGRARTEEEIARLVRPIASRS